MASLLVENGANMNTLDGDGYSPFHKAVKSNNAEIVKYFIQNGTDLNVKTNNGYNSLEVALKAKKQNAFKTQFYFQMNTPAILQNMMT